MGRDLHKYNPGKFTYDNIEKKNCKNYKRQYANKCDNFANNWGIDGADTWETCEGAWRDSQNFSTPYTMKRVVGWVGVEYEKDDDSCKPSFKGDDWDDNGCIDKYHQYARKIDTKELDWDIAADWVIANIAPKVDQDFKGGKVKSVWKSKPMVGDWWIMVTVDVGDKCTPPYWSPEITAKNSQGSNMTIQHCTNWIDNKAESCKTSWNARDKPNDGWLTCDVGFSPENFDVKGVNKGLSTQCGWISKDFNCAWGKECYVVNNVDVNWEEPQEMCDGDGRKLKIKKCNNWVSDDPESCKNSHTKGDVKKWIRCAIGSSPGGGYAGDGATMCAPLTTDVSDFNCAKALSCFAVMEDTPDRSCPINFMTNPIGWIMQKLKLVGSASSIFCAILSFCCMSILLIK